MAATKKRRNVKKAVYASPSDLHVNQTLTSVAIDYITGTASSDFVAGRVFPRVNVDKQSDRYWVFDRDLRDDFKKRAPATESDGVTMTLSSDTYFAENWALHIDIPDEHRANADGAINLDARSTNRIMRKGLIRQEKDFVNKWFKTGVWATEKGGVTASPSSTQFVMWSDAASTPIEDIRTGATAVQLLTGYRPNKLLLGQLVYDKLVNHPDIIDRIKYGASPGQPAIVTRAAMAALFEVDQIFVLGAVEDTAKENTAGTRTNAFIAGRHALLLYSPDSPSTTEPSAGYTFMWTGFLGGLGEDGIVIFKMRLDPKHTDRIEGMMFFDMKQTASDLGYFFHQAVPA